MKDKYEIEVARDILMDAGFSEDEAFKALGALTLHGFLITRTQALLDRVVLKAMEARQ